MIHHGHLLHSDVGLMTKEGRDRIDKQIEETDPWLVVYESLCIYGVPWAVVGSDRQNGVKDHYEKQVTKLSPYRAG